MRFPKKVNICGRQFKVIMDRKLQGGSFSPLIKQEIRVGTKASRDVQFQTLIHEILEAIISERMLKYVLPYVRQENGHILFVFNHQQFENLAIDLACALKPMLKE